MNFDRSKVIIDQSLSLDPSLWIKGHNQSKSVPPSVIIDQRSLSIKVRPSTPPSVIIDQSSLSIKVRSSVPLSIIINQRSLLIKVRLSIHHYGSKVIIHQSLFLLPSVHNYQ